MPGETSDLFISSDASICFAMASLPIECFPLIYDLNDCKSRINRHLLTVGSF